MSGNGLHPNAPGADDESPREDDPFEAPVISADDRRPPLPHNFDAEQRLLGGIFEHGDEMLALLGQLEVEDFYDPRHQAVYRAQWALKLAGKPIDEVTVAEQLKQARRLEAVGGAPFLLQLALRTLAPSGAAEYIAIVSESAAKRRLMLAMSDLIARGYAGNVSAEDLAAEVQRAIGLEAPSRSRVLPLVAMRDIPETFEQQWLVEGLIPSFDEGAAGYIFGPAKSRKSLLLAEIALAVTTGAPVMGRFEVKRTGAAVGFFAEDPKSETSRRIHRLARGKGIEVPSNLHLIDVPSLAIDNPVQQAALLATLRAIPDLTFAWLDPMVRLHTVNDNRAEELGPIHSFLRTLVRSLPGVTLVNAHHTGHSGTARGSTDFGAFGDFNLYLESPDDLTTRVRRIENRGGPPGQPFSYQVEDLAGDDGPAMRLVVDERDPAEATAAAASTVTSAIVAYRDSHPGVSGRKALAELQATGMKIGATAFWKAWKRGGE